MDGVYKTHHLLKKKNLIFLSFQEGHLITVAKNYVRCFEQFCILTHKGIFSI